MTTVALGATQTIETAGALRAELVAALDLGEPVEIDASELSSIDAAAMQVLIALWKTADQTECSVTLKEPSEHFRRIAALLGVAGQVGA